MSQYLFQLEDFALSDAGIHLLRNRFNFKTIGYQEVIKASIEKTTEIKNAAITLALGISLIAFAI